MIFHRSKRGHLKRKYFHFLVFWLFTSRQRGRSGRTFFFFFFKKVSAKMVFAYDHMKNPPPVASEASQCCIWHMGVVRGFCLAKPPLPPSASGLTDRDTAIGLGERVCGKDRGETELEDVHGSWPALSHVGRFHDDAGSSYNAGLFFQW